MTSRLETYLARLDMKWLVPLALLLALAPFYPTPHLVEKLGMWRDGTLVRPMDIFDLCMHSAGLVLLCARLLVGRFSRRAPPD